MNELFETMPVKKAYFKIALPVVLSMMVTLVYNLVDTFFVSQTQNKINIKNRRTSACADPRLFFKHKAMYSAQKLCFHKPVSAIGKFLRTSTVANRNIKRSARTRRNGDGKLCSALVFGYLRSCRSVRRVHSARYIFYADIKRRTENYMLICRFFHVG